MATLNGKQGDWRTVGGRRIFIADGQSLEDAMRESGKFNIKSKKEIELERIFEQIEDEMKFQEKHNYDLTSNDTDEMLFFIDEVVKPIVDASNLDDNLKKEIIGYMKMDVYDNKKWSIKKGVKTIKDWYKIK